LNGLIREALRHYDQRRQYDVADERRQLSSTPLKSQSGKTFKSKYSWTQIRLAGLKVKSAKSAIYPIHLSDKEKERKRLNEKKTASTWSERTTEEGSEWQPLTPLLHWLITADTMTTSLNDSFYFPVWKVSFFSLETPFAQLRPSYSARTFSWPDNKACFILLFSLSALVKRSIQVFVRRIAVWIFKTRS